MRTSIHGIKIMRMVRSKSCRQVGHSTDHRNLRDMIVYCCYPVAHREQACDPGDGDEDGCRLLMDVSATASCPGSLIERLYYDMSNHCPKGYTNRLPALMYNNSNF